MEGRNPVLDAWRALLILAVLCFHYTIRYSPPQYPVDLYHYSRAFSGWWQLGAYAVEVFFTISGMVITMTLLRSHDLADFAFRRFSRLFPAAAAATTLAFAAGWWLGPADFRHGLADLLLSYLLVAPDFGAQFVAGDYWSLLVELKFYLFVALAWALLGRRFWLAIVGLALCGLVLSCFSYVAAMRWLLTPYIPFFLAGMAVWYGLYENDRRAAAIMTATALLCLPASIRILRLFGHHSLLATGIVIVVTCLLIASTIRIPRLRLEPLSWLGRLSYSLYLVHEAVGVPVIIALKRHHWPDLAAMAAAAALSLALAALLHYLVELPAQRGLRQLYHVGRPHLLPSAPKTAQA